MDISSQLLLNYIEERFPNKGRRKVAISTQILQYTLQNVRLSSTWASVFKRISLRCEICQSLKSFQNYHRCSDKEPRIFKHTSQQVLFLSRQQNALATTAVKKNDKAKASGSGILHSKRRIRYNSLTSQPHSQGLSLLPSH